MKYTVVQEKNTFVVSKNKKKNISLTSKKSAKASSIVAVGGEAKKVAAAFLSSHDRLATEKLKRPLM